LASQAGHHPVVVYFYGFDLIFFEEKEKFPFDIVSFAIGVKMDFVTMRAMIANLLPMFEEVPSGRTSEKNGHARIRSE
jgi:hypothetical protein